MTTAKLLERQRMLRHEEMMSRPAHELFPRPEGRPAICRHCRQPFIRKSIQGGKVRLFCSGACRDAYPRLRRRSL